MYDHQEENELQDKTEQSNSGSNIQRVNKNPEFQKEMQLKEKINEIQIQKKIKGLDNPKMRDDEIFVKQLGLSGMRTMQLKSQDGDISRSFMNNYQVIQRVLKWNKDSTLYWSSFDPDKKFTTFEEAFEYDNKLFDNQNSHQNDVMQEEDMMQEDVDYNFGITTNYPSSGKNMVTESIDSNPKFFAPVTTFSGHVKNSQYSHFDENFEFEEKDKNKTLYSGMNTYTGITNIMSIDNERVSTSFYPQDVNEDPFNIDGSEYIEDRKDLENLYFIQDSYKHSEINAVDSQSSKNMYSSIGKSFNYLKDNVLSDQYDTDQDINDALKATMVMSIYQNNPTFILNRMPCGKEEENCQKHLPEKMDDLFENFKEEVSPEEAFLAEEYDFINPQVSYIKPPTKGNKKLEKEHFDSNSIEITRHQQTKYKKQKDE